MTILKFGKGNPLWRLLGEENFSEWREKEKRGWAMSLAMGSSISRPSASPPSASPPLFLHIIFLLHEEEEEDHSLNQLEIVVLVCKQKCNINIPQQLKPHCCPHHPSPSPHQHPQDHRHHQQHHYHRHPSINVHSNPAKHRGQQNIAKHQRNENWIFSL